LKFLRRAFPEVFNRILHVIGDGSHPQPDQRYPQKQALTQSWAQSGSGYGMLQKLLSSMHEALGQLQRPSTAKDQSETLLERVPTSPVSRTEAHILAVESRTHMRAMEDLREVLEQVEGPYSVLAELLWLESVARGADEVSADADWAAEWALTGGAARSGAAPAVLDGGVARILGGFIAEEKPFAGADGSEENFEKDFNLIPGLRQALALHDAGIDSTVAEPADACTWGTRASTSHGPPGKCWLRHVQRPSSVCTLRSRSWRRFVAVEDPSIALALMAPLRRRRRPVHSVRAHGAAPSKTRPLRSRSWRGSGGAQDHAQALELVWDSAEPWLGVCG